ncbi:DNL zinc finger-domain-containing protein [Mycena rebaudengoi]|nr:DNL zinc finger-domain-containing protein [Mycena rebaudengoi]KAJ7261857.1 DNL zinc finger-domain-containing protein [Mycena rebaudengoi]
MLPSRLFRNIGIPPPLRSLLTPHASLPATAAVQLRLRLGISPASVKRYYESVKGYSTAPSVSAPNSASSHTATTTTTSQALPDALEPRLSMTFTCTAGDCTRRSTHEFSKRAYEKGLVLVQCPGCENRHLIADHLGWFKESTAEGRMPTVEDILRARGEEVRRGVLEYTGT